MAFKEDLIKYIPDFQKNSQSLQEFIESIGEFLDGFKGAINDFQQYNDFLLVPEDKLDTLAKQFNVDFPRNMSVERKRSYLREVVTLYRSKGTTNSLKRIFRLIGWDVDINEYWIVDPRWYANPLDEYTLTNEQGATYALSLYETIIGDVKQYKTDKVYIDLTDPQGNTYPRRQIYGEPYVVADDVQFVKVPYIRINVKSEDYELFTSDYEQSGNIYSYDSGEEFEILEAIKTYFLDEARPANVAIVEVSTPFNITDTITYVINEDQGYAEYKPLGNLVVRSQEFNNNVWTKSNTPATADDAIAPDGTTTADLITISGTVSNWIYQDSIPVTADTDYTFSYWVKLGTLLVADYKFGVYDNTNTAWIETDIVPIETINSNDWTRVIYRFTTPATCTAVRVYPFRNASTITGTFWLWGAQLVEGHSEGSYTATTDTAIPALQCAECSENLMTYSEQLNQRSLADATVVTDTMIAPDGTLTADKIVDNTTNSFHGFSFNSNNVEYNQDITLSFYAKQGEHPAVLVNFSVIATTCQFNLDTGIVGTPSASGTASMEDVGNGWYRCVFSVTTPSSGANPAYFAVVLHNGSATTFVGNGSDGVYIWGTQLEHGSTVGPYQKTEATNGLFTCQGLQNLLTYSEDLSNAIWIKTAATVTINAINAPDGTLTADKIVEDTADNNHYITQNNIPNTTGKYIFSTYAKAGERSWMRLRTDGIAGTHKRTWFDLTNGVVGTQEHGNAGIYYVTDGWYRCWVEVEHDIATDTDIDYQIFTQTSDAETTYLGDGTSGIYAWGAQVTEGFDLQNYLSTEGSAIDNTISIKDQPYSVGTNNYVTNGTFDTDTSGWSAGTGVTTSTFVSESAEGRLATAGGDTLPIFVTAIPCEAGKKYYISADLHSTAGNPYVRLVATNNALGSGGKYKRGQYLDPTTVELSFTPTGTTFYVGFAVEADANGDNGRIDNVVVREGNRETVITRTVGSWLLDGFNNECDINITNANKTGVDGFYEVREVTEKTMTLYQQSFIDDTFGVCADIVDTGMTMSTHNVGAITYSGEIGYGVVTDRYISGEAFGGWQYGDPTAFSYYGVDDEKPQQIYSRSYAIGASGAQPRMMMNKHSKITITVPADAVVTIYGSKVPREPNVDYATAAVWNPVQSGITNQTDHVVKLTGYFSAYIDITTPSSTATIDLDVNLYSTLYG